MAERYLAKAGEKDGYYNALTELISNGCIAEASELASVGMSKMLPSEFAVYGEGRLGELPVYVKTYSEVTTGTVVINSISKTGAAFEVGSTGRSAVSRRIRVSFTDLEEGYYLLEKTGLNSYTVKQTESGTDGAVTADENGRVSFTVQAELSESVSSGTVSGRVSKVVSGTVFYLTVQDPDISGYCCYTAVNTETDTVFTRRADGTDGTSSEKPKLYDYVTVTFDENGRAAKVDAVYGEKTGVIKSFTLPDLTDPNTTNGIITLDDGTSYELEYQTYTTTVTVRGDSVRAREMTDDDMRYMFIPGKKVSITYCPEYYGDYQRLITITFE